MHQTRTIGREIGTALAVLAIYLLAVLAPLHQARASQLGFEALGYSTVADGWELCSAAAETDDQNLAVAKCPATGAGKTEFVLPTLAVQSVAVDRAALAAPLPASPPAAQPRPIAPPGGPRAPPVMG